MSDAETCKECGHHWGDHYKNDGCYGGWEYDYSQDIAMDKACPCMLTHSRESLAKPSRTRPLKPRGV